MPYIETRPEAIEAIHKSIREKWNPICMGCVDREPDCALCGYSEDGNHIIECDDCPLSLAGHECYTVTDLYTTWKNEATIYDDCDLCPHNEDNSCAVSDKGCPIKPAPAKSEAMLEALVNLLPEEERIRYGG
jgi:hypothetical protein